MLVMTVLYPNGEGATFDHDYYDAEHIPLVDRLWRPMGLEDVEILRGVAGPDGKASPFLVMTHLIFPDMATFSAAAQAHGAEIFQDVRKFTNVRAQTQFSEP